MKRSPPPAFGPLPRVTIVMVNWNRYEDVLFALKSIREQDYPNVEIIVVDNGSQDGSPDRLAHEPDVALVRLCKNCGPSEARNVGLRVAEGKYVLLLDSDAVIARNTLRVLVDRMDGEPDLGILGCRILNYTSRCIDQWIYAQSYDTHGHRPFDTYSFSAAGAMIRAEVLKDGTGFWEELFIYNEEVDLALQVIRKGYRVGYEPDAHVLHNPSVNGRVDRSNYFFYQLRNWMWIAFRHYPFWSRWKKITLYSSLYAVKAITNRYPKAALRGFFAGLSRMDIVSEFPEKMTAAEVRKFENLNKRRGVRLKLLRTGVVSKPYTDVDISPELDAPRLKAIADKDNHAIPAANPIVV